MRGKVFKKARAKTLKGQFISGTMLVELANSYVQALNGGQVPTIESAWDSVQASELERGLKESITLYERLLHDEFVVPMIESDEIALLKELKLRVLNHFLS